MPAAWRQAGWTPRPVRGRLPGPVPRRGPGGEAPGKRDAEGEQIGWSYPVPRPQLPVTNRQGQSRKVPASLDYYEVERRIRIPDGRWAPWTFYRNVMDEGIRGGNQHTGIPGLPPCREEEWHVRPVRPVYHATGPYVLTGIHTGPWTQTGEYVSRRRSQ